MVVDGTKKRKRSDLEAKPIVPEEVVPAKQENVKRRKPNPAVQSQGTKRAPSKSPAVEIKQEKVVEKKGASKKAEPVKAEPEKKPAETGRSRS